MREITRRCLLRRASRAYDRLMGKKGSQSAASSSAARTRVMVLGSGERPSVPEEAQRQRPLIEKHADIVAWDLSFSQDLSAVEADLAIVFGGDGSILRAAHQMGYHQVPVVGVNLGKLGFLADLSPDELVEALPKIGQRQFRVIEHLMFECSVLREGQSVCSRLGLNELTVVAGAPFSLLEVDLYVDSDLATTYSCDGLIISTPVGSTAHSLSAGGPILRKNLQAFVIVPISPHTLTNRPVVDSADRTYELVVAEPNEGTAAVVDGRVLCTLKPNDRVRVSRSEACFKLAEIPGHNYYRTLREKLGWGGRLNPRA